jgi:spermidine synthase
MVMQNGTHHATQEEEEIKRVEQQHAPFRVEVTFRFLFLSIASSIVLAFSVGSLCRRILLGKLTSSEIIGESVAAVSQAVHASLPPLFFKEGKKVPSFVYTEKIFLDHGISVTSDTLIARRRSTGTTSFEVVDPAEITEANFTDNKEVHEPAGQHLLVDIENVDGVFLNSVKRLAHAMVDLVKKSGLTMLSYHCHHMEPIGVSCVGVLLESHVSFHTWPIPGVITLDLFTCGPNSLLPLLPTIEKLFAISKRSGLMDDDEKPNMVWAYKKRGFREEQCKPEETDLNQFTLGWMEYDLKNLVSSVETDFQSVEIFDVLDHRFRGIENYKKSLVKDDTYESHHPELFMPDRVIYLDGIMQSRRYGEAAYHEALVHPAMLSHDNPRRVAIIGGGEGATLREVLKHRTVEKVTMVEIDELMVNVSRAHLAEWSDYSQLIGSRNSCFDDPRVEFNVADAFAWFVERYSDANKVDEKNKYDVIVMDSL